MNLLIYNGTIVTQDSRKRILKPGALAIKEDRILDVGPQKELLETYPDFKKMDVREKAVLPGLINLHTHTALTVLRGVAEDAGIQSLFKQMFPMTDLMTGQDRYTMALLGSLEALKSGATCIVENFHGMDDIVEAVEKIGVRAVVSEIVNDADLLDIRKGMYRFDRRLGEKLLKKGVDLVEKWHGKHNGRILCHLSPHAPDTCSPELLREIKKMSEKLKVGITLHLSQSPSEVEQVLSREGKRSVEYLESVEMLGPAVVAGHCVHLDQKEIEILGKTRTNVAHNAAINARRGWIAPITALKRAGANIGLGTDNMSEDMVEVMRVALMVGRIKTSDYSAMMPEDVFRMATTDSARALGLEREVGSLEPGKKADLVIIDMAKPHLVPLVNLIANFVHTGMASDVDTVIVDGRILMEGRIVKTVDEKEVMAEAQKTTERLWAEYDRKFR